MSKYDVAKEFTAGFADALKIESRDASKSSHWLAGWDAGYKLRAEKQLRLNEYLTSIGYEPMGVVNIWLSRTKANH